MTDVIINRKKNTVYIHTENNMQKCYTWEEDNIQNSGHWYIINIKHDGESGQIILPCERTNMITIG